MNKELFEKVLKEQYIEDLSDESQKKVLDLEAYIENKVVKAFEEFEDQVKALSDEEWEAFSDYMKEQLMMNVDDMRK